MMKKFRTKAVIVMLMMLASAAHAAETSMAEMDPAMMAKMQAATSPGEQHKVLEAFAGQWTYTGTFRMTPDAAPQEMTGTAKAEMVYGGRFLKQEFEGPWMGQTFNGLGYTGYDNIKGEYVSIWLDSMATGIMVVSGQYDKEGKTLDMAGNNSCPLTGEKDRRGRSEWTVVDADHNTYTSYLSDPNGEEFKAMEIKYTRAA